MVSTKTLLLIAVALSACTIGAMEKYSEMTIKNELYCNIFLNVQNPNLLTDKSPYPFVKRGKSKTFLLHEEEKEHQTLAFPNGYPSNTVKLPIEKHPEEFQKIIVEDSESKKVISELIILCIAQ